MQNTSKEKSATIDKALGNQDKYGKSSKKNDRDMLTNTNNYMDMCRRFEARIVFFFFTDFVT